MFSHLNIYDPRERVAVGVADVLLRVWAMVARLVPGRRPASPPHRVLVLRLERIGDLLMVMEALARLRAALPDAEIDLVVGSWNAGIADLLPGMTRVESLDVPWLAREGTGAQGRGLAGRALSWRARRYDLAINFEADIRSNLLAALSGAPVRAGFLSGGGGPLLSVSLLHDPQRHTAENASTLVARAVEACGVEAPTVPAAAIRLSVPAEARARAEDALRSAGDREMIGLHTSGGREIKQWHPRRFGEAAGRLAHERGAALVLTGAPDDRPLADAARAAVPSGVPVIDLVGRMDLVTLAAVLERLALYVTGDTGPMHLAAAVGTPIVAVFGPSTPTRYAPLARHRRIVRIDLPCSPCNQIRLPPERCRGHVPDCLEGITSDMVYRAGVEVLAEAGPARVGDRT